ncbi:amino acid ABC transporter ATP-binding/permease protein [Arthrobacter sp. AQ5-05]|uniref:amino acid ABC transporter ATP-binding/permease protein n=1 Tax=Arthrobacter sp. AQ5-05 TaxID=2184581 RepID=UPI0012B5C42E|nr:ABC transporter ATP-binding protein [Arthrobacter sp. AQ5-05]
MKTHVLIRRLAAIANGARGWLALSLLARVIGTAAAIALLAVPVWAIGQTASHGAAALDIPRLAAGLVVLAVLKAALRYAEQYTGHHAAFTLLAQMRLDLYDALLPQAPGVVSAEGSGRLMSVATRDIDRIEVFFAHTVVPAITAVLIPCASAAAIWVLAGPLPALLAALSFVVGGATVPLLGSGGAAVSARKVLELRASLAQHVAEDVAGLAEIRSFGAEPQRMAQLLALEDGIANHLRRGGNALAFRSASGFAWPWLAATALLGLAAAGAAPLPAMLAAAAVVLATAPTLSSIEALAHSLPLALAAGRRYLALLSRPPAVTDDGDSSFPDSGCPGGRQVSVEDVTVRYPGMDAAVFAGLNLEIPAGTHLAVTGRSGAGKSTLARLLMRELDPDAGRVVLGGVNIRTIPLAALRRAVTVVEQGAVLLSGSVLENLRLGNEDLTPADAWLALEQASLAEYVRSLPGELDTQIGANGERLSGGQRQRLALARALARNPAVLILDEATSHQDPVTQDAIRRATLERSDCTVMTIAHRSDAIGAGVESVALQGGRPAASPSV